MRVVIGSVLALALTAGAASAANVPPPPSGTAGPAILERGLPFGVGPVYLGRPVWLPDSAPEMRALGVTNAPGRGSIVVHAILADTRYYYAFAGPQVRALVQGDETSVPHETSSWYLATWDRAIRPFLLPGENAAYIVRNVTEPSATQPLTALVFAGPEVPFPNDYRLPYDTGTIAAPPTTSEPPIVVGTAPEASRKPL